MYKHTTVNPISQLQRNMHFVTLIFEKYTLKTSAGRSPLLYYLRNRRYDRFLSNFYLSISHKYSKDLTTVQNLLEQENTLINENALHEKNIEQKNKKVTNFYHKDLKYTTNIFYKNVLNQKNTIEEDSKPINFYDKNLRYYISRQNTAHTKTIKHVSQNLINLYHNERKLYGITRSPIKNIYTVVPLKYQKSIQNTVENKQDAIVNNAVLVYDTSQNTLSAEKTSKDTSETKIRKHSSHDQTTEIEKIYPDIEQVEIKKLTDRIFPMIMKRWQKEFERRGVFYG